MVTFPMTLTDTYPVFKVTAFLQSNISKMVCFRDKVAIEHFNSTNASRSLSAIAEFIVSYTLGVIVSTSASD